VQRQSHGVAAPPPSRPAGPEGDGTPSSDSTTSEQIDELERIVAAVERRILAELNRRSGRYGGW
jgi:hypothetical protein